MVIITIIGLIILMILLLFFLIFFLIPAIFGAPYDITRKGALKHVVKLTDPKKKDKIAELGSGDGRICIALAKKAGKDSNVQIHGFEINPFLVWHSRRKIKKLKLDKQIKIHWKNFWKIDLKDYNKIVLFQFRTIMKRLERKIEKELKLGSKIISHQWIFPHKKIRKKLGKKKAFSGEVYLYEK